MCEDRETYTGDQPQDMVKKSLSWWLMIPNSGEESKYSNYRVAQAYGYETFLVLHAALNVHNSSPQFRKGRRLFLTGS